MLNLQSKFCNIHRLAMPTHNSCFFNKKLQGMSCLQTKAKSCQAMMTSSGGLEEKWRRPAGYHPTIWNHQLIQLIQSPYHKLQGMSCLQTKAKSCQAMMTNSGGLEEKSRRSADYHPTIWNHQLIQLIQSPYHGGDQFNKRIEKLKHEVKKLFKETDGQVAKPELMDSIRRLGIGYHFEEEIDEALARLYLDGLDNLNGLNETALCFRLLREHGHTVSSDVFNKFKHGKEFMNCLSQDVKGLLSLYEATHLALPGEQIMDEAKSFSVKHLKCLSKDIDSTLVEQVKHSLEAPSYWLMPRVQARRYIDVYERKKGKIPSLFELAKLDFNVVQALHQEEIKDLSRWWEELDLVGKASFGRDRIFENYFWAIGVAFEPRFSKCRQAVTKLISIGNVIDDFYDTYATLEEAELFTTAIRRWDLEAMEKLPDYLKLCYLALYNFVNESAYDIFKESGWDVRHLLERECIHLCETYLKEAEWFHRKITPSLEEYLDNGWTSIGNRFLTFHALYHVGNNLSEESLDHMEQAYQLVYLSSLLVRLIDDLAPSKAELEKGETSLSIQCHMKDSGESYETSKEYIKDLINNYWKELNKETLNSDLPRNFIYASRNSIRSCYTMFQHGDGISTSTGIIKDQITSLFVEPIAME